MAEPNIGELVTMTLKRRVAGNAIADNVSNHIPLLMRLKEKGLVNSYDGPGGRNISIQLDYAEAGFQRFSGFEQLNVQETQVFDSAEYTPVEAAVPIAINGRSMAMNSGRSAAKRLVVSKQKNAERTMMNNIASDVMSDGSTSNQIGGLQLLVDTTPATGTVGGINAANFAFWQNVVRDVTDDYTTFDGDGVRQSWNDAALDCTRGADRPDMIVADSVTYNLYLNSLQTLQRYSDVSSAGSGFNTLKFQNMDVFYDSTVPANQSYMLNTDYLEFLTYPGGNFEPSDKREPYNQRAFVQFIFFMGNLTCSNRSLQAVIKQ